MKKCGGIGSIASLFLTSTLDGGEWSASRAGGFAPGKRAPGAYWIEDLVDPRADLDSVQKKKYLNSAGNRNPAVLQPVVIRKEVQKKTTFCHTALSSRFKCCNGLTTAMNAEKVWGRRRKL
jgi:hypothetical protein